MGEPLLVTRDGAVAVLTIDRPAKRNAMTAGMWAALPGLLETLAGDPAVRVLVVTGAGPSFCAGADISDLLGGADPDDPMADLRRHNLAAQAALRLPQTERGDERRPLHRRRRRDRRLV